MKLEDLDVENLNLYIEHSKERKNINGQLNGLNILVRKNPTTEVFNQLADIYREMGRTAIEAIYLKAAIDKSKDELKEEKERLEKCKELFLQSNEKVKELIPNIEVKPYSNKIIKERKTFHEYLKKGETNKAYLLGLEQHNRKRIDPEIQGVWCSICYRRGNHQLGLVSAFIGFINNPADWVWITNAADILIQLRKASQALDYSIAAVNLKPDSSVGWLNLGAVWELLGKTWESMRATKKAIQLNPKNPGAWTNLGNAYKNSGELLKALPAYQEALKLEPSNSALWSNLLFGINYDPTSSVKQIAIEHFKFGEYTEKKIKKLDDIEIKNIPKIINVGFVSPDIRSHPVAYFVEPLWLNLDKNKYRIYFYDNFPTEDQITKRFKTMVYSHVNISGKNDEQVVSQILEDEIHILVDMSGHTARNRLQVFARKPAPIQVTWLGHPNTTGLSRIDWRITDYFTDPSGNEINYSEKLCRIPTSICYSPLVKYPEKRIDESYKVKETPALKNSYITFGTCNNLAKISPEVIIVWSEILNKIPNSKLLIEAPGLHQKDFIETIKEKFKNHGVQENRLILVNRVSSMQYLRYHEIDIALDPFPYGGGTTTCDLLWMGVPMVTMIGERPMSRAGYGILNQIGHPEWVANNNKEYIDIALKLGSDISKLNSIRLNLRNEFSKSLMMDSNAFVYSIDNAFDEMLRIAYSKITNIKTIDIKNIEIKNESLDEKEINLNAEYIEKLKLGDELMSSQQWKDAFKLFDGLRDEYGAEPNALFGAGLCCANLNDHERATRFMADALLRRMEPKWIPWLASSYEKRNFSLPFYILSVWLYANHKERSGSVELYNRAKALMTNELLKRGLVFPENIDNYDISLVSNINLKVVQLLKANNNKEALELAEENLIVFPTSQPLIINASLAAKRLQLYEKAAKWSLYAFAINPLGYGAITNFGNLLVAANSPFDSMLLLEAGAIIHRDDPMLWGNLAVAYNSLRVAPWEAEFAARHALKFNENIATNWSALAKALSRQGRMSEALLAMERACEIEPERIGSDLFTLQYAEEMSPEKLFEAHLSAGKSLEASLGLPDLNFPNTLEEKRRLKIAFVTGDLVGHPVAYFMYSTFKNINHNDFDVTVYFTKQKKDEDGVSEFFKLHSDKWLNVFELTDEQLDSVVRRDSIDILIDLAGHTAHNRLAVFARKPAPVQVTWLGHPNTTGLKSIDWRFTHIDVILPSHEKYYTEKIWRMKTAGFAYTPLVSNPSLALEKKYEVQETPALKNGYITFGCCNNLAKISESTLQLWAAILKRNENSKLLLEAPGFHQREFKKSLINRFEQYGVKSEQLLLLNRDTNKQYLIYNDIDIALDPFPYNGGTTTCDLLWMGIPMVTMTGVTEVARLGTSMLNLIEHPEWIATNSDEYIKIACDIASNLNKLNQTRHELRQQVQSSPLMNGELAIQNLEHAFRHIWKEYVQKVKIQIKLDSSTI